MADNPDRSSPPALALLGVLAGPRIGEEYPIVSPVVSIGQGPQNDVVIDDDSVSRSHARLEFSAGSWLLTDLESTNGTTVEGVRLAPGVPTPLAYANTVRLGGVRLQFREVAEADPEAARAAFHPAPAAPDDRPRHFRLPLWVVLLILLLIAVAVVIFLMAGGAETAVALREALPQVLSPARGAQANAFP